jgi:predicted RNA binding protein YcfA (HicA-like mRNA interferase family)
MESLILRLGFREVRRKGSHVFYRHPDGRVTTIPHHKGRDLARPLIVAILREIQVSAETFTKLLKKV